jgi:hypothetical protein
MQVAQLTLRCAQSEAQDETSLRPTDVLRDQVESGSGDDDAGHTLYDRPDPVQDYMSPNRSKARSCIGEELTGIVSKCGLPLPIYERHHGCTHKLARTKAEIDD